VVFDQDSPFQMGTGGFTSFPERIEDDKVRGKPEKFGDHYSQATLFWNSQTPYEKAHIVRAFRFELTKVQVPAIRERTVAMLRNVSDELARPVADALGLELPRPMPRVSEPPAPEVNRSPALSLTARPGDGSIRGRRIAILVAPGTGGEWVATAQKALTDAEAVVRLVGARLGPVETADGDPLEPDGTLETMPSVLFDAVVVPDGAKAASTLAALGHAREFLRDQYRHCKPILLAGTGVEVAKAAGLPTDDQADWAVARDVQAFIGAVGKHRNWDRATDPPRV
jgi:catalase